MNIIIHLSKIKQHYYMFTYGLRPHHSTILNLKKNFCNLTLT